jgi:hypothetical protein
MMAGKYILIGSVLLATAACSSGGAEKTQTAETVESIESTTDSAFAALESSFAEDQMTISDIPFPFMILEELYEKRVPFNPKVVNNVKNVSRYSQYNQKALNLGVYGADLSYAVTYEQFQQIGTYIKVTKKLADELNIPLAFDGGMMDRYSSNKDNKDSLTNLVYDSYTRVDAALKDDERKGMAALVVAGSWLEGLYLSTRTFLDAPKSDENASLYKTIQEQKKSLKLVVKMLEQYKDDAYFAKLITDLNSITSEYNNISESIDMNEKQLISINSKVAKLRNRITEGL